MTRSATNSHFPVSFQAACGAALLLVLASLAAGQGPLLHYHFNEPAGATTAKNVGSFMPGASPLLGLSVAGTSCNGTAMLIGAGGTTNELTTPLALALGTGSWTVGFCINNSLNAGGFQYLLSEDVGGGFRVFTNGAAGSGNIRLTGGSVPATDIPGGAGDAGWVHVAWVHDTVADQIRGYLDGTLTTSITASSVNLASGNVLRIGRLGTTCLQPSTLVDDFRLFDRALSGTEVASWAQADLSSRPDFRKVMISEVSWVAPRGLEITNFGISPEALTNWTVKWTDAAFNAVVSDPLNVSLGTEDSLVVADTLAIEPVPAVVLDRFTATLPASTGAFTVALVDAIGTVVDEVQVSAPTPGTVPPSLGGRFRGLAPHVIGPGMRSAERIWGLDSDGGLDWTLQVTRTFGRENTNDSTDRGFDNGLIKLIRINEIDDSPDFIELYNPLASAVDLSDWFLLMSSGQGNGHHVEWIPAGVSIPGNGYVVIGDTASAPAEKPAGVAYVQVGVIPFDAEQFSCVLYDALGRVIDVVRSTRAGAEVVHNDPRAPSYWSDFVGAARRFANGGDRAIGRGPGSTDSNAGSDFYPIFTRTMGSSNASTTQAGPAGWGDGLDVRLNETGPGQGFAAIINAGPTASGLLYGFLISATHSNGFGPFLGLGTDALANLPLFYHVSPFAGVLNSEGAGRIEFAPGSLPVGVNADFVFFLQDGSNALVMRTLVLEFDT